MTPNTNSRSRCKETDKEGHNVILNEMFSLFLSVFLEGVFWNHHQEFGPEKGNTKQGVNLQVVAQWLGP